MKTSPYEPEGIDVRTEEGMPAAIKIGKRTFKVLGVLNMWRIDEDWWRQPISRLYFLLELDNGSRVSVFKDMIRGHWYTQRYGA
jgi:hypothetical protein